MYYLSCAAKNKEISVTISKHICIQRRFDVTAVRYNIKVGGRFDD